MRIFTILCFIFSVLFAFSTLRAEQCRLVVSTPKPLLLAGKKQTTCVKVAVKGFNLKSEKERAPLNVCLVIDRSGSMTGRKIERAKEAAVQALERFDSRDIVSVVTFDSRVEVIVPATKVSNREEMIRKISEIQPRGSTALYEGTKVGGEEVKKFFDKEKVNRIVLLSDGQANVGPSSSDEIAKLGGEIGERGIAITTLGLGDGYNEDLMAKLASTSDGNHAFIEEADELADIFKKEFNTALSVVAQEADCTVTLPEGIRPVRSLNMDVDIEGREVRFAWNQIYSNHERYVLIEVEIPATEKGKTLELAKAELRYTNMETKSTDRISGRTEVRFVESESEVKARVDRTTMEDYVEMVANLENKRATQLRDQGKVEESQKLFMSNALYLDENAVGLGGSERLKKSATFNRSNATDAASPRWSGSRKTIIKQQRSVEYQQAY